MQISLKFSKSQPKVKRQLDYVNYGNLLDIYPYEYMNSPEKLKERIVTNNLKIKDLVSINLVFMWKLIVVIQIQVLVRLNFNLIVIQQTYQFRRVIL